MEKKIGKHKINKCPLDKTSKRAAIGQYPDTSQLPGIASIAERLNPERKEQVPGRGKLLQPLCPHLYGPCT